MKIPDRVEHERAFIKRLNILRAALKKQHDGQNTWVEATEEDGAIVFYLTMPALSLATHAHGAKVLRLERPNCENCHDTWAHHAPPGGKCLFGPTSYDHD